jgi:hypothetical protein
MKYKWTSFLIWIIMISLFCGMIIPALVVTVILLFTYMYNAMSEEAERRARDKEFNEYLRVKGRLN